MKQLIQLGLPPRTRAAVHFLAAAVGVQAEDFLSLMDGIHGVQSELVRRVVIVRRLGRARVVETRSVEAQRMFVIWLAVDVPLGESDHVAVVYIEDEVR